MNDKQSFSSFQRRTMEDYHNSAKRYERWKIITTQQSWTDERRGPTNRHVR